VTVGLTALSSEVYRGDAEGWRQRNLTMAVCNGVTSKGECICKNFCVTFQLPSPPPQPLLDRLGIKSTTKAMGEPFHVALSNRSSWCSRRWGEPPKWVADAVAAAALGGAPRPTTAFTPVTARLGLPASLRYMQPDDVVLWKGVPHFVLEIGEEVLFRTAELHGLQRGMANPITPRSYLEKVAREIEPPRTADIEWAHAAAAAAKDGAPKESPPPPPPPPPVWRSQKVAELNLGWCLDAKAAGLPVSLGGLRVADVVTCNGEPYFVSLLEKAYSDRWAIELSTPEQFALSSHATTQLDLLRAKLPDGFKRFELLDPYKGEPVSRDSPWWSQANEDIYREESSNRAAARAEQVQALTTQLAVADEEVAEAARVAADAAALQAPAREAEAKAARESRLKAMLAEIEATQPWGPRQTPPEQPPDAGEAASAEQEPSPSRSDEDDSEDDSEDDDASALASYCFL